MPATAWILCAVTFWGRMFFITAGYHRYFSHRAYKTSRAVQLVLAFGGGTAAQKGPLWWAGHHRNHHRYTDTEQDLALAAEGLLVEPRRLDPLRQDQRDRSRRHHEDFDKFPELALPRPARLDRPVGARRSACFLIGRLAAGC